MKIILAIGLCLIVVGCAGYNENPPLIFANVNKFGVSASATLPDQGGDLTVGYRSAKAAIVPVTAKDANGNITKLEVRRAGNNTGAFSTFSHFEATAGTGAASAGATACLGDTFATGFAAQKLAQDLKHVCK